MFDENATALAETVSKIGYVNENGKIVKGGASVMHHMKESAIKNSLVPQETAGALAVQCSSNPTLKNVLLASGCLLVLGLAVKGAADIASDLSKKYAVDDEHYEDD